jgi:hypothetical protein
MTHFNGSWMLELRKSNGTLVWGNAGDGKRTPQVELCCESPLAVTWRLTFHHASGDATYTLDAEKWGLVSANAMHLESNGKSAKEAPERVTVVPG